MVNRSTIVALRERIAALPAETVALRPVRALPAENAFRFYTGVTARAGVDARAWCATILRRCALTGGLKDDAALLTLDVLDAQGDVIDDFPLSRRGLEYLREKYDIRVDREGV